MPPRAASHGALIVIATATERRLAQASLSSTSIPYDVLSASILGDTPTGMTVSDHQVGARKVQALRDLGILLEEAEFITERNEGPPGTILAGLHAVRRERSALRRRPAVLEELVNRIQCARNCLQRPLISSGRCVDLLARRGCHHVTTGLRRLRHRPTRRVRRVGDVRHIDPSCLIRGLILVGQAHSDQGCDAFISCSTAATTSSSRLPMILRRVSTSSKETSTSFASAYSSEKSEAVNSRS